MESYIPPQSTEKSFRNNNKRTFETEPKCTMSHRWSNPQLSIARCKEARMITTKPWRSKQREQTAVSMTCIQAIYWSNCTVDLSALMRLVVGFLHFLNISSLEWEGRKKYSLGLPIIGAGQCLQSLGTLIILIEISQGISGTMSKRQRTFKWNACHIALILV